MTLPAPAAASVHPRHWTIHCDGSAMPNPGRMGIGAVITQPDGTRHTLSLATHTTGCNNEAELRALTLALQEARDRGASAVLAYSDNSILVEQLGAADARPIARLAPLYDDARALLGTFDEARVQWIPRHRNGEADALARAALGAGPKPPPKPWKKRL
ncbi:ribonuclease HI family protein [Variovorax sp. IB41]|uniref:ribonuclease HI family protein n=1 Tax=Variovorax sp. IB41 TaxID=2779370 RepID=UPI0018E83C4B|nr:ribonuclease HI family protein [Variovorax sp. IB41]MBJ2160310.1 ribonuclease HI family protein [Variovorax sp. IB41]